jgi:putative endonuclease
MRNQNTNKSFVGKKAEELAASYLAKTGFEILEKNFRTRWGEIDIVARDKNDKNTVVFVEVKFRKSSNFGAPYESVDRRKQERLMRAAWDYILSKKISDEAGKTGFRFDVISISLKEGIQHFRDAFVVGGV